VLGSRNGDEDEQPRLGTRSGQVRRRGFRNGREPEHTFAHSIDPDVEEACWPENAARRPCVGDGKTFNEFRPACRYGVDGHRQFEGRPFDGLARELTRNLDRVKGTSSLTWENTELAARDAWQRLRDFVERTTPSDSDHDAA